MASVASVVSVAAMAMLLAMGCGHDKGHGATAATPTPRPTPTASPSTGADPNDPQACASDGDCVVSCLQVGDCCGQLCDCTNVYSERFEVAERKRLDARCGSRDDCPVADCAMPESRTVAHCKAGRCVGAEEPIQRPN